MFPVKVAPNRKRHELYHTSRPQKTPAENRQGSSINPPTTNYGWGGLAFCASFMTSGANISFGTAIIPAFSRFGTFLARGSIDSLLPNLEVPA